MKKYILIAYRSISFIALFSLLLGIIWYGIGFIVLAGGLSNWAVPIKLSPTQERVLQFQPQVANLEASALRQQVERASAKVKVSIGQQQLDSIDELIVRVSSAQRSEATVLSSMSKEINSAIKDKSNNIALTDKLLADTAQLLKIVDDEEKVGLITKDQASTRRISLQGLYNQATDAKSQYLTLKEQGRNSGAAASTFLGGSTSLQALQSVQAVQQLKLTQAQLGLEVLTAEANIAVLNKNLSELERILNAAKQAPQYRALRETITVVFAPYTSVKGVTKGDPIYDCYFMYFGCYKVGEVLQIYEAEEYARHPFLKTDLKGKLLEIRFDDAKAIESQVVFIRNKPLLI